MDENVREEPCSCDECAPTKGMGWRVSLSILVGVGWLSFLIIWLFFYASHYSGYQNFAIFLLSIVMMAALVGIPWAIWGWRLKKQYEIEMWATKGFKGRVGLTIVLVVALAVFLIYWFWYIAQQFTIYQNIAIFIVSLLIFGGIIAASWASWGMRYSKNVDYLKEKD